MLLHTDVARLVLGYLAEENCPVTYQSFVQESPHLKSMSSILLQGFPDLTPMTIFGKSLCLILNEYYTMKDAEAKYIHFKSKPKGREQKFLQMWKKLEEAITAVKSFQVSSILDDKQHRNAQCHACESRMAQSGAVITPSAPSDFLWQDKPGLYKRLLLGNDESGVFKESNVFQTSTSNSSPITGVAAPAETKKRKKQSIPKRLNEAERLNKDSQFNVDLPAENNIFQNITGSEAMAVVGATIMTQMKKCAQMEKPLDQSPTSSPNIDADAAKLNQESIAQMSLESLMQSDFTVINSELGKELEDLLDISNRLPTENHEPTSSDVLVIPTPITTLPKSNLNHPVVLDSLTTVEAKKPLSVVCQSSTHSASTITLPEMSTKSGIISNNESTATSANSTAMHFLVATVSVQNPTPTTECNVETCITNTVTTSVPAIDTAQQADPVARDPTSSCTSPKHILVATNPVKKSIPATKRSVVGCTTNTVTTPVPPIDTAEQGNPVAKEAVNISDVNHPVGDQQESCSLFSTESPSLEKVSKTHPKKDLFSVSEKNEIKKNLKPFSTETSSMKVNTVTTSRDGSEISKEEEEQKVVVGIVNNGSPRIVTKKQQLNLDGPKTCSIEKNSMNDEIEENSIVNDVKLPRKSSTPKKASAKPQKSNPSTPKKSPRKSLDLMESPAKNTRSKSIEISRKAKPKKNMTPRIQMRRRSKCGNKKLNKQNASIKSNIILCPSGDEFMQCNTKTKNKKCNSQSTDAGKTATVSDVLPSSNEAASSSCVVLYDDNTGLPLPSATSEFPAKPKSPIESCTSESNSPNNVLTAVNLQSTSTSPRKLSVRYGLRSAERVAKRKVSPLKGKKFFGDFVSGKKTKTTPSVKRSKSSKRLSEVKHNLFSELLVGSTVHATEVKDVRKSVQGDLVEMNNVSRDNLSGDFVQSAVQTSQALQCQNETNSPAHPRKFSVPKGGLIVVAQDQEIGMDSILQKLTEQIKHAKYSKPTMQPVEEAISNKSLSSQTTNSTAQSVTVVSASFSSVRNEKMSDEVTTSTSVQLSSSSKKPHSSTVSSLQTDESLSCNVISTTTVSSKGRTTTSQSSSGPLVTTSSESSPSRRRTRPSDRAGYDATVFEDLCKKDVLNESLTKLLNETSLTQMMDAVQDLQERNPPYAFESTPEKLNSPTCRFRTISNSAGIFSVLGKQKESEVPTAEATSIASADTMQSETTIATQNLRAWLQATDIESVEVTFPGSVRRNLEMVARTSSNKKPRYRKLLAKPATDGTSGTYAVPAILSPSRRSRSSTRPLVVRSISSDTCASVPLVLVSSPSKQIIKTRHPQSFRDKQLHTTATPPVTTTTNNVSVFSIASLTRQPNAVIAPTLVSVHSSSISSLSTTTFPSETRVSDSTLWNSSASIPLSTNIVPSYTSMPKLSTRSSSSLFSTSTTSLSQSTTLDVLPTQRSSTLSPLKTETNRLPSSIEASHKQNSSTNTPTKVFSPEEANLSIAKPPAEASQSVGFSTSGILSMKSEVIENLPTSKSAAVTTLKNSPNQKIELPMAPLTTSNIAAEGSTIATVVRSQQSLGNNTISEESTSQISLNEFLSADFSEEASLQIMTSEDGDASPKKVHLLSRKRKSSQSKSDSLKSKHIRMERVQCITDVGLDALLDEVHGKSKHSKKHKKHKKKSKSNKKEKMKDDSINVKKKRSSHTKERSLKKNYATDDNVSIISTPSKASILESDQDPKRTPKKQHKKHSSKSLRKKLTSAASPIDTEKPTKRRVRLTSVPIPPSKLGGSPLHLRAPSPVVVCKDSPKTIALVAESLVELSMSRSTQNLESMEGIPFSIGRPAMHQTSDTNRISNVNLHDSVLSSPGMSSQTSENETKDFKQGKRSKKKHKKLSLENLDISKFLSTINYD